MDEIVYRGLSAIPPHALTVRLARSTIKMDHVSTWRVNKSNTVHDLIVCLTGSARYRLDGEEVVLSPGRAMLVPAGSRFRGKTASAGHYTGIAQHFSLDLFGSVDMILQMRLKQSVELSSWAVLEPLVRHYRDTAPDATTTLAQHHTFMVILLHFLEDAFVGWRATAAGAIGGQDTLSMHIMFVAAQLAASPLTEGILETAMDSAPYNADYFRRAFKERIGVTPQKFLETKKLETAMHVLGTGKTVKETAALVGYRDVYFFSRMFKRYMGASPASYQLRRRSQAHGE